MKDQGLSEYRDLYISTARSYIDDVQKNLATLKKDGSNKKALEVIHRSAHSLKSQSKVMNFDEAALMCESIEHIFQKIIEKGSEAESDLLIDAEGAFLKFEAFIDSVESGKESVDLSKIVASLKKYNH